MQRGILCWEFLRLLDEVKGRCSSKRLVSSKINFACLTPAEILFIRFRVLIDQVGSLLLHIFPNLDRLFDRLDEDLRTGCWNLSSDSLLFSVTSFCSATDAVVLVGAAG